jgi:adenosylhomocysteine nucleosidase
MMPVVVLISANSEWRAVTARFSGSARLASPFESLQTCLAGRDVIFLHGGWGKISASASTQYAIDRFDPAVLINLGTCGGFAGQVERGQILLVTETLVYDVIERMSDPQQALDFYTTRLDLSWLAQPQGVEPPGAERNPQAVRPARLVSADQDLDPAMIAVLTERFGAVAADWESGAIAWTAARSGVRCLILRGVSDLVGSSGGEAYGEPEVFHTGTQQVMDTLLDALPGWLARIP